MNAPVASPVLALDARYYTDPALFEAELNGLLAKSWQYAGHISQVPNKGDYFTFQIGNLDLFVIRDMQNDIKCYYNVCQHRAHQLVSGEGTARVLVCPYHAWTYGLDGKLMSGPNLKAVPGFNKEEICLTEVNLDNFNGFLFVNADPNAKSMDEMYPGVRQQLADFVPNIEQLAPIEWVDVDENCNWKVSVENYSECYHCAMNHATFTNGVVKPNTYNIRPQGYALRHTTECVPVEQMTYDVDMTKPHAGDYSSWFMWPCFSFQVYPGNVLNTYLWRPVSVDKVKVWRGWYTEGGIDNEDIRRLAQQDRITTVEEDILLIESVQRGLNNPGYKPGPLVVDPKEGVNSEHSIMAIHNWIREAHNG